MWGSCTHGVVVAVVQRVDVSVQRTEMDHAVAEVKVQLAERRDGLQKQQHGAACTARFQPPPPQGGRSVPLSTTRTRTAAGGAPAFTQPRAGIDRTYTSSARRLTGKNTVRKPRNPRPRGIQRQNLLAIRSTARVEKMGLNPHSRRFALEASSPG